MFVIKVLVYLRLVTILLKSSQNGSYSMTFSFFVTDTHISCSGMNKSKSIISLFHFI